MSEHAWVRENVASYLAEGLEPAERQRLEEHVAACPACAEGLEQARSLDETMHGLFADVRPGPALEDRMIQALRLAPRPRRRLPLYRPLALGTAAAVLLAALGLFGSFIADRIKRGELTFPGASRTEQVLLADNSGSMSGDQHTVLPGYAPAFWSDTDALARYTREQAVATFDDLDAHMNGAAVGQNAPGIFSVDLDIPFRRNSFRRGTPAYGGFTVDNDGDGVGNSPAASMGGQVASSGAGAPAATDDGVRLESIAAQDGTSETLMFGERLKGLEVSDDVRAVDRSKRDHLNGVRLGQDRPYQVFGRPSASDHPRFSTPSLVPDAGGLGGGGLGGGGDVAGQAAPREWGRPDQSQTDPGGWNYYSYRNNAPAAPTKEAEAGGASAERDAAAQSHFKPADLLAVREAARRLSGKELELLTDGRQAQLAGTQELRDQVDSQQRQQQPPGAQGPETDRRPEDVDAPQEQPSAVTQRKIIRSGEMEFEVDSFDSTVEQITKITAEETGFIATVDSERLPNGKVRGSVVVRVPPERLDTLVLKLRALGELKSQRIGSQDVTKQYTDLESRLRAARAMEERLLEMIKNGQGDIEHLLEAEKELGVWRTKIEEIEGELRYYSNVIALSTLRIGLAEQEIRAAAALTETEQVQMGIEVEDVEQAHREALEAIAEADGLVTKSEIKQHAAEQYSALIHFEVARDAAGPLRDRLRQIGNVARLEIDRVQQAEDGTSRPADGRTVQKDTQFVVSLYNVANVAPRETIHLNLACTDTEAVYKTVLQRVEQAGGRVVTSSLNSENSHKTTGSVQFEMPTAAADAVLTDVKAAGEVMRLEVTENPDSQNVTKSKRGFNVQLWAMGLVAPRETVVLQVAAEDVPAGYAALQEAVRKTTGRILNAQLNEQDKQNITAQLDFDIPRDAQPDVTAALAAVGEVFSRTVTRSQDDENVIDSKVRLQVALINQARIPPRETITLGIEVRDVDQTVAALTALAAQSKGRTVESHLAHERSGRVTAKLVFDVPLTAAGTLVEQFKASGTVRAQQSARNPQVPDGKLAIARLDVTLSNAELIVPRDEGLWAQIRTGLSTSFTAISWSLIVVIVGLCFVLPWALVLYVAYRVIARLRRKAASGTPAV